MPKQNEAMGMWFHQTPTSCIYCHYYYYILESYAPRKLFRERSCIEAPTLGTVPHWALKNSRSHMADPQGISNLQMYTHAGGEVRYVLILQQSPMNCLVGRSVIRKSRLFGEMICPRIQIMSVLSIYQGSILLDLGLYIELSLTTTSHSRTNDQELSLRLRSTHERIVPRTQQFDFHTTQRNAEM